MKRRRFLQTAAGMTAAGLAAAAGLGAAPAPAIRRYRTLGRTGLQVSDLCLGSYGGIVPRVVDRAYDLGVTYFDTAPDYRGDGARSEESIGRVFGQPSKRDRVALATRMCAPRNDPTRGPAGTRAEAIVVGVEDSLRRLRTDRIDVLLAHGVGELGDDDLLEAFARLKKAGKARFLGMGCHGPRDLVATVARAVDSGHYDMVQVAYNFFAGTGFNFRADGLDEVFARALATGVGVLAMKTRAGARPEDAAAVEAEGEVFAHACFRWVWSHPAVAGILVTASTLEELDLFAAASGQSLGRRDEDLLRRYAAAAAASTCHIGCGDCLDACPHGVEIPTVLRYQIYCDSYGATAAARRAYAALPDGARPDACATCAAPCAGCCLWGVDIPRRLLEARGQLDVIHTA